MSRKRKTGETIKVETGPETTAPGTARQGSTPGQAGAAAGLGREADAFPVVGIGASAGGLTPIKALFGAMPPESGQAFVLVTHMDPTHQSLMVELLSRQTAMPVCEAKNDQEVRPDHIYVIPPNRCLKIEQGRLKLEAPPNSPRSRLLAIDLFLISLAADMAERAVGIILSGTGSDGAQGAKAIVAAGGVVLAQDPETAEHDSMPRHAIATGMVDLILPVERMPEALIARGRHALGDSDAEGLNAEEATQDFLERIFKLLRAYSASDFRAYRQHMLLRRVRRRMGLRNVHELEEYLGLLRAEPDELAALYKDLLIGVTSFFRDGEAFETLRVGVIPELVRGSSGERPVRVWVPGCASGEEAYSIAMLFLERFEADGLPPRLQIFASDIDEGALEVARKGVYPESIAGVVSPERLRHFFTKGEGDGYRVVKALRDCVVFATQNLLSDTPFSKLDLISCRNLLIYLEPEVQGKVLILSHFALREGGYLLLGPSESLGRQASLFEPVSAKWRVFRRVDVEPRRPIEIPIVGDSPGRRPSQAAERVGGQPPSLAAFVQKRLLGEYAPPSVLVNRRLEVLCFQGETVKFLEFPSGEPTRDLAALARKGLRTKLRAAVSEAYKSAGALISASARVERAGRYVPCTIKARLINEPRELKDLLLITFEDQPGQATHPVAVGLEVETETLVGQLESELKARSEELHGTIEELESSNEELKSSNEEMMSLNEELQSTNEEMETSKEELQLMNEEITTVNNELNARVEELDRLNNDITNLLHSTEIPTVFLAPDLTIRRFTPAATGLFRLRESDVGRPIEDVSPAFEDGALMPDCHRLLEGEVPADKEVWADDERCFIRRIQPYRTSDNPVDGLVLTFVDITEQKRAADQVDAARLYAEGIVATVREPLIVMDETFRIHSANPAFIETFQLGATQIVGQRLFDLDEGKWNVPEVRRLLQETLSGYGQVEDVEITQEFERIGRRTIRMSASVIQRLKNEPWLVLLAIEDVTDRRRAETELRTLNETLEQRVAARTDDAERRAAELLQSERFLGEQRQLLQAVVDSTREGLVMVDEEARFLVFNPAANDFLGVGAADISPEKWPEHYGLFEADRVTPVPTAKLPLMLALRGQEVVETELFVRNPHRPDGVWLSVSARPMREDGGRIIGAVATFSDISTRKEAEARLRESEARLRTIVDTATDAIFSIDENGVIDAFNPSAQRMFGWSETELTDRNIGTLIALSYWGENESRGARRQGSEMESILFARQDLIGRRRDGSKFPCELRAGEQREGAERRFTLIIRDVSERKVLERQLLSIAEEEQRRIGQNLHDDIGQELTGLALKSETLTEILNDDGVKEHAIAADISAGLTRARAKVRALSMGLVPVEMDPEGLIHALRELASRMSVAHHVSCSLASQEPVLISDQRIATSLYHIAQEAVTNAVIHGKARNVHLVLEESSHTTVLTIRDDGIGIPADLGPQRGMGLRLMRYRAGLIGGRLEVVAIPPRGTRVTCLVERGGDHGQEFSTGGTGGFQGPDR